jgi:endoglucanase
MPLDIKAHLKKLCEIPAPPGHEGPLRDMLRDEWAGLADDFQIDGLGSLIAVKHGTGAAPRRRIMLAAHMDEIALMVAEVRDGFIRTCALGGIDWRVLLMQPVLVHGRRALPGVFGAAPPHMARSRKKYPDPADLWVDLGLPADEVADWVRVGDLITFDAPPLDLKGKKIAAKSLDNRASVAAVTVCLDELSRRVHLWDVAAVASVQEEVGCHGAITAAYQVNPDIAIAVDTTFGLQSGVGDDEGCALGGGPTLSVGPNFHPRLVKALRDAASDLDMKIQTEALPGNSGTDAWLIQVSREGVPCALIGIPVRNLHTPSEVVDLRDVKRAGKWMAAFIAGLMPDFLDEIAWPVPDHPEDEERDSEGNGDE